MAACSVGSGTISFGLVSIPFKLFTAHAAKSIAFNTLHRACGSRLHAQLICSACNIVVDGADVVRGHPFRGRRGMRRLHRSCGSPLREQLICPVDNVVVERADTVRGFEHQRDQYVTFTDVELKELESARSGVLDIQELVPASTVDAQYIKRTYFLGPDQGADRAYRLLATTLERRGLVAVGRFARRGRDALVVVRPYRAGIVLQELFYADEVRAFDEVETGATFEFKPLELDLADRLIEQLEKDSFDPSRFKDEWADKVLAAVNQKVAGDQVTTAPEAPKAQIIDLLEALKRSVASAAANTNTALTEPSTPVKRKATKLGIIHSIKSDRG